MRASGERRQDAAARPPAGATTAPAGPLAARLEAHLRRTRLLEPGQRVIVALSGGLDSVVLLHLLRFGLPHWRLEILAAHFDHRMRGGSGADAVWVRGLCRAWELPLRVAAAEDPPRDEAAARAARYAFLEAAAEAAAADRLATAHHADDQAETVLFRIARGAGLRGLAGIPERRGRIVRPLLPFPRADLARYAAAAHLGWRDDPTNLSLAPARNRIRHRVLPQLEAAAPGAARALVRLARHARAADQAWERVASRLLDDVVLAEDGAVVELARDRLLSYHPFVRARLLRTLLRRYGSSPDRAGTRAALEFIRSGKSGGGIALAGGLRLEREFERIRVRRAGPAGEERSLVIRMPRAGAGEAVVGGRRMLARWTEAEEPNADENAAFALDSLRFPLELRGWRAGDRIRLAYGTKKLKKLFAERRVGRSERERIPVLVDSEGRVVWVAGLARAAACEPVAGRPIFQLTLTDADQH